MFLAPYKANQLYYATYSAREGETYEEVPYTLANMYNEYFGSSMNAIVFQEMRERGDLLIALLQDIVNRIRYKKDSRIPSPVLLLHKMIKWRKL